MGQGGQGHPLRVPEVGGEIPARDLSQARDQIEKPAIGTTLEKDSMPLVFEIHGQSLVAAGMLQSAVDLPQPVELIAGKVWRQLEGEGFQHPKDLSYAADFRGVEGRNSESPSDIRLEDPFSGQANERFADGCSADAQGGCEGGVSEAGSGDVVTAVDAVEDPAVDLIAEWGALDGPFCKHTIFCIQNIKSHG